MTETEIKMCKAAAHTANYEIWIHTFRQTFNFILAIKV